MRTFLAAMWPTFFIRVSPASRNAKPACMNITSTAAKTTHTVDAAIVNSLVVMRLRPPPGACPSDLLALRKEGARGGSTGSPMAPSLHEHDVAPGAVEPAQPLAQPHDAEAAAPVQLDARGVLGEDAGLQRPDAAQLAALDERLEQGSADAAAAGSFRDVDALLGDACVDAPAGVRPERRPAEHLAVLLGDEPVLLEVSGVPVLPGRRLGLEGRDPGRDALLVDRLHGGPVAFGHGPDHAS